MEGKRIYLQPTMLVFNALLNLMELQNGKKRISDQMRGELYYNIMLFGVNWKLRFNVTGIEFDRCCVKLSVSESGRKGDEDFRDIVESMIRNEFALLDNVLLVGSPQAIAYCESGRSELRSE